MNARQMLAGLPMSGYAEGGAVEDPLSAGRRRAIANGNEAGWLQNVASVANKWLANPGTAAEAYDGLVKSGISVKDLTDAGISQDAINKAFRIETPKEQSAVNDAALNSLTSTLAQNPTLASEMGARGAKAIYEQAQQYVANLQKDGLTADERQQLQRMATAQGWGYSDIRAAGIDPALLFEQPAPVATTPVTLNPVTPVFANPVPYTPVTVYDPEKFARENAGADLYKKGEVALDTAFRESAPRTAIPGMPGAYEYTPAAKLRPATGAGMSWTPPVVTSRPRSLLSPTLLSYVSPSQQFAQARATQDQALLGAFRESGLPQNASNFNTWRNRLRSGEFGTGAAFDPTAFQSAFGSWASTQAPGTTAQGPAPGPMTTMPVNIPGYSEIAGGLQPIDLRRLPAATFAHGGEVSSARRMLEQVKKPEGFAEGGMPTTGPEQTESRSMLERLGRFISLDTPQDMSLGETAADIGMGFLPGVGTAQGARDFERARREGDMLGMALSAASMIPVAGGVVRAARSVGKASKAVDVLPAAERQVNLERFMEGSNAPPVLYTGTSKDVDFDKMNVPRNGAWLTASPESASMYAVDNDSKGLKYVPETRSFIEVNTSSRVMPVHLSAKNPYVITDIDAFNKELYALAGDNYRRGQGLIFDKLRSQKYDSVHFVDPEGKEDVWVALGSPTQMKSAVGNRGTFDPTSPVLTKKDGGEVAVPETESRSMLERLQRFTSLDTPQDMGLGETVADIGMGFLPGVGTAQGARDFERSRREGDRLGMALGAASMIPVVGGAVRAARKAANVAEEIPSAARQMLDTMPQAATPRVPAVGTPVSFVNLRQAGASRDELRQVEQDFKGYQSGVQSVDELVNTAARVDPMFQGSVRDVANIVGGSYVAGPPKTAESVSKKLTRKGGTAADVADSIRATVLVENNAQAEEAVRQIASRYPTIDEGWQRIPSNGYIDRKLGIQFTGPNGERLLGEIQINTPPMQTVKDEVGHKLYKIEQKIMERYGAPAQMPAEELMRYRDAVQEQSRIYGEAATRVDPSILEQLAEKRARGGYIGRLGRP